jgi:hypothetical protein
VGGGGVFAQGKSDDAGIATRLPSPRCLEEALGAGLRV